MRRVTPSWFGPVRLEYTFPSCYPLVVSVCGSDAYFLKAAITRSLLLIVCVFPLEIWYHQYRISLLKICALVLVILWMFSDFFPCYAQFYFFPSVWRIHSFRAGSVVIDSFNLFLFQKVSFFFPFNYDRHLYWVYQSGLAAVVFRNLKCICPGLLLLRFWLNNLLLFWWVC